MTNIKNTLAFLQQLQEEGREDELLPYIQQLEEDLSKEGSRTFLEGVWDYFDKLWKRVRWEIKMEVIPTGFKDIDNRLYGAAVWEIMTICARTWVWKTTLWLNIALNMLDEHKVWFISLEMTKEEILDRIISRECNIWLWTLTENYFKEWDVENIKKYWWKAKEKIDKLMMAYNCFDIDDIIRTIEEMADSWCEAVFVDWLWMIDAPGGSRPEKMNYIMQKLKSVAIGKHIAIITMQQLNRQMDSIARDEPELYDIADWSAVEKISSPVLILWKNKDEKTDETFVSLFKTRRMSHDLKEQCVEMARQQDKKRQDLFFKIKLKDDLWHCSFRDYERNRWF